MKKVIIILMVIGQLSHFINWLSFLAIISFSKKSVPTSKILRTELILKVIFIIILSNVIKLILYIP